MMQRRFITTAGFLLALACSTTLLAGPVSMDEIRKKFSTGEWSQTLRMISEAMNLRGDRAAGFDRYELFMMKGQSLLRLKSTRVAATAFDDARKSTEDMKLRVPARAWAALARSMNGANYAPKRPAAAKPIEVFATDASPHQAMLALHADMLEENQSRIRRAEESKTLDPILELVPTLGDMWTLELTATGADARTAPILQELGGRTRELIARELKRIGDRVEQLRSIANDLVVYQDDIAQRGLYSQDQAEVERTLRYVAKIADAAREGRRMANLAGGGVEQWQDLVTRCEDLTDEMNLLLSGPGVRGG